MKQQASRINLTSSRVEAFNCPPDKTQAFLWDENTPTLALRVTPTGRKTFTFETRLNGATMRINIGTYPDWPIQAARIEARKLKTMVDAGLDPREAERERQAIAEKKRVAEAVHSALVSEVWAKYLAERRPHWGKRHFQDHLNLSRAGGKVIARGTDGRGVTIDMPLYPLMQMPLRELTAPVIEAWAAKEALTRPTSARLAWRLLKGFLGWCSEQPDYAGLLLGKNPAKTKRTREALGKPRVKSDVLQRGQLGAWFAAVQQLRNPTIAAYLQTLLLTGARPGEVMTLQWQDINSQWRGITIRDKVEGERVIPLTPFVHHLLAGLPKRNEWIFASATSASGHLSEPTTPHTAACKVAGLEGLTLHGLRRSFKSLTEWLEVPVGVVAQIQGHKPSATAEKHYTVRPLELLALHHEKIEAWILEQAGVALDSVVTPGKLRVITS